MSDLAPIESIKPDLRPAEGTDQYRCSVFGCTYRSTAVVILRNPYRDYPFTGWNGRRLPEAATITIGLCDRCRALLDPLRAAHRAELYEIAEQVSAYGYDDGGVCVFCDGASLHKPDCPVTKAREVLDR